MHHTSSHQERLQEIQIVINQLNKSYNPFCIMKVYSMHQIWYHEQTNKNTFVKILWTENLILSATKHVRWIRVWERYAANE